MSQNEAQGRIEQLAAEVCKQHDLQFTAFFEAMDLGFDVAEDLYLDVEGKLLFSQDTDFPMLDDAGLAAVRLSGEMAASQDPSVRTTRGAQAGLQLALEDELGRLVAQDPPAYVRRELGRPPSPRRAEEGAPEDARWWVRDLHLQQPLSKQGAWERAAGALVALVEGRCDGDPRQVEVREAGAQRRQDTMEGRVLTQHFSDVSRTVELLQGPIGL